MNEVRWHQETAHCSKHALEWINTLTDKDKEKMQNGDKDCGP